MKIVIQDTRQIIGMQHLISVALRTDLVPIPVTLELSIKLNDELEKQIQLGKKILVGADETNLTIVKIVNVGTQTVVNDKRSKAVNCIAVLTGCEELIKPTQNAIISYNTSIAGAYKALGCSLGFSSDLPLLEFLCPCGTIATPEIALRLQEECAVISYENKKLSAKRIKQCFESAPVLTLDNGAINWFNTEYLEASKVSMFVTLGDDNATFKGLNKANKAQRYYPNSDTRRIKNLSRVLIKRGVATRALSMNLNAGNIIQVDNNKYIILTALHRVITGALGGATETASYFWLGSFNK